MSFFGPTSQCKCKIVLFKIKIDMKRLFQVNNYYCIAKARPVNLTDITSSRGLSRWSSVRPVDIKTIATSLPWNDVSLVKVKIMCAWLPQYLQYLQYLVSTSTTSKLRKLRSVLLLSIELFNYSTQQLINRYFLVIYQKYWFLVTYKSW